MKPDGGPAFPQSGTLGNRGDMFVSSDHGGAGITIRDYFAGMAMQALLTNHVASQTICNSDPRYKRQGDNHFNFCEVIALNSYEFADAMLKVREQ